MADTLLYFLNRGSALKTFFVQKVIDKNLTIFRSYVNGYYWLKNKYNDVDSRNLGYYSPLQTDLSNYFRSLVIDWLNDSKNCIISSFGVSLP